MKHVQATDLRDTAKIAEIAKDTHVLIARNGETVSVRAVIAAEEKALWQEWHP